MPRAGNYPRGENHPAWRGQQAGYHAMHRRVRLLRGDPTSCVFGCSAKRYEWASMTGCYGDPNDYAQMCASCHKRFDHTVFRMQDNDPWPRPHKPRKPGGTPYAQRGLASVKWPGTARPTGTPC